MATAPNPDLVLPDDAPALLAFAQQTRPELRNFSHCTDCIKAVDGVGRYVHLTHRNLRLKRAKLADAAAAKADAAARTK